MSRTFLRVTCPHTVRGEGTPALTLANERGQGATEYVILVLLVALVCLPIVKLLPAAVREYVRPFYYCISRPIP